MSVSRNPYDRRQDAQARMYRDAFTVGQDHASVPPRSLTIDDLDVMAFSARARGRREEMERAIHREHAARRQAWDEGYSTGREDGREGALADFFRLHGSRLQALSSESLNLLESLQTDARKVSKADLAIKVAEVQALLTGVLNSHMQGFRVFE